MHLHQRVLFLFVNMGGVFLVGTVHPPGLDMQTNCLPGPVPGPSCTKTNILVQGDPVFLSHSLCSQDHRGYRLLAGSCHSQVAGLEGRILGAELIQQISIEHLTCSMNWTYTL